MDWNICSINGGCLKSLFFIKVLSIDLCIKHWDPEKLTISHHELGYRIGYRDLSLIRKGRQKFFDYFKRAKEIEESIKFSQICDLILEILQKEYQKLRDLIEIFIIKVKEPDQIIEETKGVEDANSMYDKLKNYLDPWTLFELISVSKDSIGNISLVDDNLPKVKSQRDIDFSWKQKIKDGLFELFYQIECHIENKPGTLSLPPLDSIALEIEDLKKQEHLQQNREDAIEEGKSKDSLGFSDVKNSPKDQPSKELLNIENEEEFSLITSNSNTPKIIQEQADEGIGSVYKNNGPISNQ